EYRQIQRGADHELLAVEIAAELARLDRGAEAVIGRRRYRQNTEERAQRYGRAPRQAAGHRAAVDWYDATAKLGIVLRQRAAQRPDQVPAPVDGEMHRRDADLECVAGLGATNRDRPGENVRPRRWLECLADRAMMRQHDRGVAD